MGKQLRFNGVRPSPCGAGVGLTDVMYIGGLSPRIHDRELSLKMRMNESNVTRLLPKAGAVDRAPSEEEGARRRAAALASTPAAATT
jgi:hypothetical protein